MGVFPQSNPPPISQEASMNMISTSSINKGNSIVDLTSVTPFKEMYLAIQSTSDTTINDHILVASDTYHLLHWLENLIISILYLAYTPL